MAGQLENLVELTDGRLGMWFVTWIHDDKQMTRSTAFAAEIDNYH